MLAELYLAGLAAKAREAELQRQLERRRLLEEALAQRRAGSRRPRRAGMPLASLRPRPSRA